MPNIEIFILAAIQSKEIPKYNAVITSIKGPNKTQLTPALSTQKGALQKTNNIIRTPQIDSGKITNLYVAPITNTNSPSSQQLQITPARSAQKMNVQKTKKKQKIVPTSELLTPQIHSGKIINLRVAQNTNTKKFKVPAKGTRLFFETNDETNGYTIQKDKVLDEITKPFTVFPRYNFTENTKSVLTTPQIKLVSKFPMSGISKLFD